MPIISGPVQTLLVALAAIIALVLWLRRERRYRGPRLADDEIDREELEAAEREVRDLDPNARPEDGFLGDDWGPGSSRPRPPERL
ncbi:MAG: hypothetical protein M3Q37_07100 [Gemmatimonadota bacterium]|nr:hypothetical protein [Gemmatimonadales bacterium]MDQ3208362.1 hypothetical protein [Gemmatimonadota bacterium]